MKTIDFTNKNKIKENKLAMTNQIRNKINEIFGEEVNKNRNLILKKYTESNKLIKRKLLENKNDKYELITDFNKRNIKQEDSFKESGKIINKNNDNEDISPRRKKRKLLINSNQKNNKKINNENKEKENYYLSNNNIYLFERQISELRKDKKIKFLFEKK